MSAGLCARRGVETHPLWGISKTFLPVLSVCQVMVRLEPERGTTECKVAWATGKAVGGDGVEKRVWVLVSLLRGHAQCVAPVWVLAE